MNATTGQLINSSVGLKLVMAVTGAVWVGFVVAHMAGNLLVYAGPEAINAYGHFIQEGTHGAVWILRAIIAGAVLIHVWAAFTLISRSHAARPDGYAGGRKNRRTTYAAVTMRYGGPALLLFILFHLSHLTFGWSHPEFVYGDVYANLVSGFRDPLVSGVYIAAMVALGLHLYHGIRSGLQTVGLATMDARWPAQLALLVATVVAVGNISFPVSVLAGILELP